MHVAVRGAAAARRSHASLASFSPPPPPHRGEGVSAPPSPPLSLLSVGVHHAKAEREAVRQTAESNKLVFPRGVTIQSGVEGAVR